MFAQFFANYLLENNYIEKRELVECLKKMKNSRVKLGVLAIDAGYLTAAQVEEVHAKQMVVDKRIGDIAIDLEYLTREQVDELLSSQPPRYLSLCQTLVDKEYLNNAELEKALSGYKDQYDLTDEDLDDAEKIGDVIRQFYMLDDSAESDYCITYIKLLMNNLVRFIGDDFVPIGTEFKAVDDEIIKVSQKIVGVFSGLTAIRTDEISLLQFVSRYAGEDVPVWDEYAKAAAGDFLNLHNGLFLVNMSQESNVELKLEAPETIDDDKAENPFYFCVPVMFPFGVINFVLEK